MTSNLNNEIVRFSRESLRKTTTRVKHLSGQEELLKVVSIDNQNGDDAAAAINGEIKLEVKNPVSMKSECDGFVKQLEPDYTCDEIIPHLYLSADHVACNLEMLKKRRITHILNITKNVENLFEKENIVYKKISVTDLPNEDILKHFEDAFKFIDDALLFSNSHKANNVLVHCNMGVSRSSSFVIGYLLKKSIFENYKSAYEHVKQCRPKILPNKGFIEQIKKYEKLLRHNK